MTRRTPRQTSSAALGLLLALVLLATAARPADAQLEWRLESGATHTFASHDEAIRFLASAEVTSMVRLEVGVTRPYRITLEQDGVVARAVFRIGNTEHQAHHSLAPVRDSYDFEVAAYRLARMLDLPYVPPAVQRTIRGVEGTVQLWVEGALTGTEAMSQRTSLTAVTRRERQRNLMLLFDTLVNNMDRHQDNQLFDTFGRIWFIDHTRAFRASATLRERERLPVMPLTFVEKLEALDKQRLRAELGELLTSGELKALYQRSRMLAKHLRRALRQTEQNDTLIAALPDARRPLGALALASHD